jgi:hypothetical protein
MLDDDEWKRVSSLFHKGPEGNPKEKSSRSHYANTSKSPAFTKQIQMFCMTIACLSGGHRVKGAASR